MTLDELRALGADLNAGHVDFYDAAASKHLRLADVTAAGDIVFTPEGEAWMALHTAIAELDAELDAEIAADDAQA